MGKLDGKVCIVTGASRGIGKAVAELFASEGAKVAVVARTVKEGDHVFAGSLDSTVSEIAAGGGEVFAIAANLAQADECLRVVAETREKFGPIDVLVNNAALTYYYPLKEFPANRWLRSMDVNFHAPFYLSQEVLKDMLPRRSGAIVNISSGAAIGPGRGPYDPATVRMGHILYGAEKAALERMTQGLASECFADNVSVTAVSPSKVVPTPGAVYHKLIDGPDDPRGEPVDYMARAVLLLATEPVEKISGRVCYDQPILKEFGWIPEAAGRGVDTAGSGYSQI